MTTNKANVVIVGAEINGLVAANYLQRAGRNVTIIDRGARVGGACISATASINGERADYAQIYCEGAAMLNLNCDEPFDRLAAFLRNMALSSTSFARLVSNGQAKRRAKKSGGFRPRSLCNYLNN